MTRSNARTDYHYGLLLVGTAAFAWSLSGLFTRGVSVDTSTILFWRGLFGALGLLILLFVMPGAVGLRSFRTLNKPAVAYAAVTSLSMFLFIGSLKHTSVAHVAIITATVPFFAALLGWVLLKERPGVRDIVASIVALCGIVIMSGASFDGTFFGDALAFLMALCMAGMILISRRFPDIPALPTTCLASALTAIATLPFAALVTLSGFDMAMLLAFALINQVLGFGAFAAGARYLPPTQSALITALDAPLAPLWVWLVFSETPTASTILGGSIVMIAVVGHILHKKRS
jgi:drug/metabolite transporter (DMT)-like permease